MDMCKNKETDKMIEVLRCVRQSLREGIGVLLGGFIAA